MVKRWMTVITCLYILLVLCSCGILQNMDPTVLTLAPTTQAPTTAIKFDYAVQYVSTAGVLDFDDTAVVLIDSEKQLQTFILEYKYMPNDGIETYDDSILSSEYNAFIEACEKYDEEFFNIYSLIFVITHSSSSVKHEMTGISHMEDGKLQIHMKLIAPEVCTSDVAGRLCIIELEKNDMPASVDKVAVYMDDKCIFKDGEVPAELKPPSTHIPIVYSEPPSLWIHGGSELEEATLSTYTWSHKQTDEMWSSVCADSSHPLALQHFLKKIPVSVDSNRIKLEFQEAPDSFIIRSWSDAYWDTFDAPETPVKNEDILIELNSGGYIYEVTAVWEDDGRDYFGTVHYCFYVVCE